MLKRYIMIFALLLISRFALAQQTDSKSKARAVADAAWARAGCGADTIHFSVKMDKNRHTVAEPESGKALVYVFEEDLTGGGLPTTRIGVDGKWVGGNVPESYLFFPAAPGVHRLCSNCQGWPKLGAAVDFTAEEGKSYFFRVKISSSGNDAFAVEQVPEAEGHFLIASHGLSTSAVKSQNEDE